MTRVRRFLLLLLTVILAAAASSCVSLPRGGPVHSKSVADNGEAETLVDYTPAGPRPGSAPVPLVDNWLTSMTATPLNTYVAREFLTDASSTRWVPERGTVVYGSQELLPRPGGVVVLRLRDVVELDDRGAWQGDPTAGRGHDYDLRLVREDGQWRISHPPDRLLIPRAHLDSQYQQYLLYFANTSSQILVPEPVYVPRGRQAPTLLVTGLLKGPEKDLGGVEQTFLPPGTSLDGISVPVTRSGTAEVPLSDEVLDADDDELKLVFAQLAWTLSQVPGVQRLQVTVSGTPIDLKGTEDEVAVSDFSELDPSLAWASASLYGVRDRRVVLDSNTGEQQTSGPFGVLPLAPRWIAVDPLAQHVAGVSTDGRTVVVADRDGESGRVATLEDTSTVFEGGTQLLRPAYDLYGQLWIVDRTPSGAQLTVVRSGVRRSLEAPGLTGAPVSRFLLSRDGTRLVTEVSRGGRDQLYVARVRRDGSGRVLGITRARRLVMDGAPDHIRDIAWRTPTALAVLAAPSGGISEVLLVKVDGSTDAADLSTDAALFRGRAERLVTSPSTGAPLFLETSTGRLYLLSSRGQWKSSNIKPGLRSPTFVG
jgi:hypothetical protein